MHEMQLGILNKQLNIVDFPAYMCTMSLYCIDF